jgi:hypothetical protein
LLPPPRTTPPPQSDRKDAIVSCRTMDFAGVDPDFELALQAVQRDINWYAPPTTQPPNHPTNHPSPRLPLLAVPSRL